MFDSKFLIRKGKIIKRYELKFEFQRYFIYFVSLRVYICRLKSFDDRKG